MNDTTNKAPRLSDEALAFALEWCAEGYEGEEGDDNVQLAQEFAAWATAELERRRIERAAGKLVRRFAKEGLTVPLSRARKAIVEQLANEEQA